MRILLINPPKKHEFSLFVSDDYNTKARSDQPPLGLMYLAAYLKVDHNIKVLDMSTLDMTIEDIDIALDIFKPEIVGITCVISKWVAVRELSKEIKKYDRHINIVAGGINPSLYPYETLNCLDIDYVISGFGQVPFKKLCYNLENNIYSDIKNCYTIFNCDKNTKGTFEFSNIDEFQFPDRNCLPVDNYVMPFFPVNPVTSMVTSIGCPYKCSFCASKNFKPMMLRTPENITEEMKHIKSIGIRGIIFNDELFTMSTKRIKGICSLIINKDINLVWSVRSRANLINKESIELMKATGCFNIHLGIESGTDRILSEMKKGINIATIKQSVAMIKEVGLSVTASFMLGYPDETEEEILATIKFAKDLKLNSAQFFIVQPEPDTELYKEVYPNGRNLYSDFTMNPDGIDLTQNIASTIFSKKELEDFIKYAYTQTKSLYNIKGD